MERVFLLQFIILGAFLLSGCNCQEFVTLNLPSRAPFAFHPKEELSMDLSEIRPLYVYASSQSDYTHQTAPENKPSTNLPRDHQHQSNRPRPRYANSPAQHRSNQQHNKPSVPLLTYGFQPKPSTNKQTSLQGQRQEKHHSNQNKSLQHNRPRARPAQEHDYQPAIRQENNNQRSHFAENIQVQASVQQNRQIINSHSIINHQRSPNNFNRPFNYHLQQFESPEKFVSQTPDRRRSNRNNQGLRGSHPWEENIKPANNFQNHQVRETNSNNHQRHKVREENRNNHQLHQVREENRNNHQLHQVSEGNRNNRQHHQMSEQNKEENINKRPSFEDTTQAFKSRSVQNLGNNPQPKLQDNFQGQSLSNRHNQNRNERLNLQPDARSMRGDNKPQLPPRPSFNNGGVMINTLAGELPVVHLDSASKIDENLTAFLQNINHQHSPISNEEQEKKTYLLIKAQPTEAPTVTPFMLENLKYTSPPYILNNLAETTLHIPEVYATVEPRSLPNNVETPIVLDLVQIPDHSLFNNQEKDNSETIIRPEFRTNDNKERNSVEHKQPTESYPKSSLHNPEEAAHQNRNTYTPFEEDKTKHQNKVRNPTELFQPTESYPVSPLYNYEDIVHQNEKDYAQFEYDTLKYHNNVHNTVEFQPTESYTITPVRNYDSVFYENKHAYAPNPGDTLKYQNRAIPKPKIKELKKNLNISQLHPVSYSSSVSVVAVKQNVEAKTPATKKQKVTLKKAIAHKKKQKDPENGDYIHDDQSQNVPGEPGIDYPNYKDIPETTFDCKSIKSPGFYADLETGCQVFHNCDTGRSKHSFMCPNGTIFHQELFICDWWYNVKCDDSPEFYTLNSGTFMQSINNDDFKKK